MQYTKPAESFEEMVNRFMAQRAAARTPEQNIAYNQQAMQATGQQPAGTTLVGNAIGKALAAKSLGGKAAETATTNAMYGTPEVTTGLEGLGYQSGLGAETTASALPQGLSLGGAATNLASLGPLAGAGVGAGVLGGLYLGGKGLSDLLKGKETKGATGWGGRATLGIATGGLSEVARAFGLGRKSLQQKSKENFDKLVNKGMTGFNYVKGNGPPTKKDNQLTGKDIEGFTDFYDKYGNDWFSKFTQAQRDKETNDIIAAGAVKQKKGGIDIDWNKVNEYRNNQAVTKPLVISKTNPINGIIAQALKGAKK